MGGKKNGCIGTKNSAIKHFWIYKICEGWATKEMQQGVNPFTFIRVIKTYIGLGSFEDGKFVHE